MTENKHTPDDDPTRQLPVQEPAPRPRRKGLVVATIVAVLAVLVGGAYVVGYLMAGDKTPKNASVDGVAIGGLGHDEAVAKLTAELGDGFNTPITLTADGTSATVVPAESGMTVDFDATVSNAGAGKSWNPTHIWNVLSGGGPLEPVTVVDENQVTATMATIAPKFEVAGKDATIRLDGIKVVTTPSVQKATLDQQAAAALVIDAWRTQNTVTAPLLLEDPAITSDEVDKVKVEYADKALSGPVTVKLDGGKTFPIDVSSIAAATSFPVKDGTISAATDMDKIWADAEKAITKLGLTKGKDARFTFAGGKPTVVPSTDGMTVDKEDFVKLVQPAITASGADRTVSVKVTKAPAKLSTEDATKLGVKEVTGEFTTTFPHADYRNTNLSRAAASMNGKLVLPGETFSMNDTLGPRTPANGYVDGYVIQGSRLVKETGGGISQSATTVFNAIFFAGLEDVEHHPHTLYFPRYPAGREATLYYGQLDLKFKNNTDHGVLIQAFVNKSAPGKNGSITVKIWSTKVWQKVESTPLTPIDYYDTPPITSKAKDCEPQSASPGFTVNYERLFYRNGAVVKREPFSWKYAATPKVTCAVG
ncbi:VanW family protein [Tessaracoccus sp. SD287]|uniref:VanW family protein n=1 Tax=Tessaracoccus sp. SD287 TaxID=2782008 RepID=UPI001A97B7D2|nr:VanW family protein [Tessaracoccus sp. SD287]MBO1031462.1 VanW family protein [Tessaracoccus sp. SD287]